MSNFLTSFLFKNEYFHPVYEFKSLAVLCEDSDEDRRLHVLDLAKGMVFFVVHNIGHKHETENETAIPGKI